MKACIAVLLWLLVLPARAGEAPADFWLGVVRADGVLAPLARFRDGEWSTPWPEFTPDLEIEAPLDHAADDARLPLSEIPAAWRSGGDAFPVTWHFTRKDGGVQPLTAQALIRYPSYCSLSWGIRTAGLTIPAVAEPTHIPAGIATSEPVNVVPMQALDVRDDRAGEMLAAVTGDFERLETAEIAGQARAQTKRAGQLQPTGHPLAAKLRRREPVKLTGWYRSATPVDGRQLHYVEIARTYRKPANAGCDAITVLQAWLLQGDHGMSLLHGATTLTDCDGVALTTLVPAAVLRTARGNFLVSTRYGHEWEHQVIDELTAKALRNVVNRYGGGC
jgi:hypothetical protein